jgi:hypothetical protein
MFHFDVRFLFKSRISAELLTYRKTDFYNTLKKQSDCSKICLFFVYLMVHEHISTQFNRRNNETLV